MSIFEFKLTFATILIVLCIWKIHCLNLIICIVNWFRRFTWTLIDWRIVKKAKPLHLFFLSLIRTSVASDRTFDVPEPGFFQQFPCSICFVHIIFYAAGIKPYLFDLEIGIVPLTEIHDCWLLNVSVRWWLELLVSVWHIPGTRTQ